MCGTRLARTRPDATNDTKMADSNLCPPEGVTALELRNTVLAYWSGRTTSLKYSAVSSIRNALFQKYGCSE